MVPRTRTGGWSWCDLDPRETVVDSITRQQDDVKYFRSQVPVAI